MEKQNLPSISTVSTLGVWSNPDSFAQYQRMAIALSQSHLVPKEYQGEKGVASCLIALNMAQRMDVDPLMLMQNMDVIQGKPSLSSKFLIAKINGSNKFTPLRFEFKDLGKKNLEYSVKDHQSGQWVKKKVTIEDRACRAYTTDIKTNEKLVGEWVSMETAVREGWYGKKGSKWLTMPGQMLRYRAASWWSNIYYPEGKLGMPTKEESFDVVEIKHTEQKQNIEDLNETVTNPEIEDAVVVDDVPKNETDAPPTDEQLI